MWLKFLGAGLLGAVLTVVYVRWTEAPDDAPEVVGASVDAAPPAVPETPPEPADPDPARRIVLGALGDSGVSSRAIAHGVYPLRGRGRGPAETLPLISFNCPLARECASVLAAIDVAAQAADYGVVPAKRDDVPGRPWFRALVKGDRPALAVRAMPGGPRLVVLIEGLGEAAGLAEALVALPDYVTYAVDPRAPHGPALIERLNAAKREVLAHVNLQPSDPAAARERDLTTQQTPEAIEAVVGEALTGVVGLSVGGGGQFSTSGPHIKAVLVAVAVRGAFVFDPLESPASLSLPIARTLNVRTATRTHHIGEGDDLAAELRGVEAALVLDGRAVLAVAPSAANLAALPTWLSALEQRKIRLLRMSEVVR